MGSTIWQQELESLTTERMEDPQWAKAITQILSNLRYGVYDQSWVDIIFQKWERVRLDLFDAFGFLQVWGGLMQGQILCATIGVGHECQIDSAGKQHQDILNKYLHPLFSAEVNHERGGGADDDGCIWWGESIQLGQTTPEGDFAKTVCKGQAPLEIGYTNVSTTIKHLAWEGKLVRWPYGNKHLTLLYVVDENLWRPESLLGAGA